MKPLHVGLLVIGAAIAGGLAVRMSQPPPTPVASAAAPVEVVSPAPLAPKDPPPEPVAAVISAPPATSPPATVTPAPPPLYETPAAPKRQPFPKAPMPIRPARYTPPAPAEPLTAPALPASQPVAAEVVEPRLVPAEPVAEPTPAPKPVQEARKVTLYQGAPIAVRLDQSLSTEHIATGDTFQASLAEPVVADGLVIAERGARVTGRVVNTQRAGRLSGTSVIELALSSIQTADGQRVALSTETWVKQGDSQRNSEAAKIGGGAVLGAIIGAVAGGGAGAAIGAGAGGALGAGAAAARNGKALDIPSETVLRFRLAARVTITERAF